MSTLTPRRPTLLKPELFAPMSHEQFAALNQTWHVLKEAAWYAARRGDSFLARRCAKACRGFLAAWCA